MPKQTPIIVVEIVPGEKYPNLEAAQRAALPSISENLQKIIRDLLMRGVLVNDNGKIIPNPKG